MLQEDDSDNFTAIWVFKPTDTLFKLEVYQEFSISKNKDGSNERYEVIKPEGGYITPVKTSRDSLE